MRLSNKNIHVITLVLKRSVTLILCHIILSTKMASLYISNKTFHKLDHIFYIKCYRNRQRRVRVIGDFTTISDIRITKAEPE